MIMSGCPLPRPQFTWRFEFAAAVSPSIPFFLSVPRSPPTRFARHYLNVENRQIRVKSPETWHVFFAWPLNSPSHYTLEKVYVFWKVLQPRPQGFSLKKMGGDEVGMLWSWHVFASFAFIKRFYEIAWVRRKSASWTPWAVSVNEW